MMRRPTGLAVNFIVGAACMQL